MGNWGHELFTGNTPKTSLEEVVWNFPPGLKQAMYAAASRKVIKRGTWKGCALNEAGKEVHESVDGLMPAARTFKVPPQMISNFVQVWDMQRGSDVECTRKLLEALKKADLWRNAETKPPRIFNVKVYESQQSALHRQFEELMKFNAIPDEDIALGILETAAAE